MQKERRDRGQLTNHVPDEIDKLAAGGSTLSSARGGVLAGEAGGSYPASEKGGSVRVYRSAEEKLASEAAAGIP